MEPIDNIVQDRVRYLWEHTDFASTIFNNLVGYAIIAADFDGHIIAFNEGARQIYGYNPEEVIGRENIDIFFPEEFIGKGNLQHIVSELVGDGRFTYEGEKVKKDGTKFTAHILFTLAKDKDGQIVGFIEIVKDLTEQKQMELSLSMQAREKAERLERLEKEFRSLTEFSSSPVASVTAAMYGITSLRGAFSDIFQELVKNYQELIDLALEQQIYKVEHDTTGHLRAIAETLGFYKASPRDVVDIHTTALKEKIRTTPVEKKKAYIEEGWLLVLELMGDLASFYRNRSYSAAPHKTEQGSNGIN